MSQTSPEKNQSASSLKSCSEYNWPRRRPIQDYYKAEEQIKAINKTKTATETQFFTSSHRPSVVSSFPDRKLSQKFAPTCSFKFSNYCKASKVAILRVVRSCTDSFSSRPCPGSCLYSIVLCKRPS